MKPDVVAEATPEPRAAPSSLARIARASAVLGQVLLRQNLVTPEQVALAIEHQRKAGRRLGQTLIDLGFTTPEAVLAALSLQLGVPAARLDGSTLDLLAVQALPEKVARRHLAVPLQKVGLTLQVAIARPLDLDALDDLRFASGCHIQTRIALEDDILAALDRFYEQAALENASDGPGEKVTIASAVIDRRDPYRPDRRQSRGRRQSDCQEEFDEATEQTAVRTVDRILARAASSGASDIHLEPAADYLRVRFRVDGTLQDIGYISTAVAPAIGARLKILAEMDIAEHRVPQDGRISVTIGDRRLDFRGSTYPTIHGEKFVLRVLDRDALRLDLVTLGMRAPLLDDYREDIKRPEGLILVTGPTGSGKTSTLYSSLRELLETGRNITTIENPVESDLPGTNQGQINDKAGFTFVKALRAVLRQDPDIIMVGEIRDTETLTTAIEASLTGHLVFSTLHTNSAVGTVTRLLDMGVEPYFVASGVLAIVAQRLVRRICAHCETEEPVPAGVRHMFGKNLPASLRRGAGCKQCGGTGFSGRLGIYEMVQMTDTVRDLILNGKSEAALLKAARAEGTSTLREQCLARVRDGVTTLEEVVRVTQ